jgi:hypothetical protein
LVLVKIWQTFFGKHNCNSVWNGWNNLLLPNYSHLHIAATICRVSYKKLLTSPSHVTPSLFLSHTHFWLSETVQLNSLWQIVPHYAPLFISHVHIYSSIFCQLCTTTSFICFFVHSTLFYIIWTSKYIPWERFSIIREWHSSIQ